MEVAGHPNSLTSQLWYGPRQKGEVKEYVVFGSVGGGRGYICLRQLFDTPYAQHSAQWAFHSNTSWKECPIHSNGRKATDIVDKIRGFGKMGRTPYK